METYSSSFPRVCCCGAECAASFEVFAVHGHALFDRLVVLLVLVLVLVLLMLLLLMLLLLVLMGALFGEGVFVGDDCAADTFEEV